MSRRRQQELVRSCSWVGTRLACQHRPTPDVVMCALTHPPTRSCVLVCVCVCRGDEQQGGMVQHLFASSVCCISCLPADVPAQVLPEKEAVVRGMAMRPQDRVECAVFKQADVG